MMPKPSLLPRWLRNTLIFPLLFLNGWLLTLTINYLQPMVSMVLMAIILAIVLDYPVKFLQSRGLSRPISLALVVLMAIVLLPLLGFLLVPALIQQLGDFINQLPEWVSSANGLFEWLNNLPITQALGIDFSLIEAQLTRQFTSLIRALGSTLVGLLVGGFSGGLKVFFIIVLTIFMLTSGGQAWAGMMGWLSPWWRERLATRVPYKFRRFITGQMMLATGFGVVLAIIFTLLRVPLALMFAFLIGMASLFPFMGAIAQTTISLFVMLHDFGTGLQVFAIALILGQILDEVILPKVMGGIVGVNPIWLIISVFIGARLGGVVGILIAVPVASIIKEVVNDLLAESGTGEHGVPDSEAGEIILEGKD
jgi:predicted PurR-regulated permease PerM